jgi:RNA polymerase sigma factor (sigma-70 family)
MVAAAEEIYLSNADLIERALAMVCRRHGLYGADAEDFASTARLHLIENDYAVLRQFQGRSSLPSYLVVVITRQFQDWRNARWGKWRPSAEAKRLGETAVRLETLTVRDGLTIDEAYEVLRTHHKISVTRAELESMAARFPVRHKKSFVDEEAMSALPSSDRGGEESAMSKEAERTARRAAIALTASLRQLPPQDRLILKMRFEDSCPVARIADALQLEQKPLYRRIDRLLFGLRRTLESEGVKADELVEAWAQRGFDMLDQEKLGEVRPFSRSGPSPALTGGHHD